MECFRRCIIPCLPQSPPNGYPCRVCLEGGGLLLCGLVLENFFFPLQIVEFVALRDRLANSLNFSWLLVDMNLLELCISVHR